MNERIKELALRAGAVNVWEWASDDVLDTKNMDAEKFAELIVRECIEQVFYTIEDQEQDNISSSIRDRIKQHFGVEE
jgi:hypothetical protein